MTVAVRQRKARALGPGRRSLPWAKRYGFFVGLGAGLAAGAAGAVIFFDVSAIIMCFDVSAIGICIIFDVSAGA
jgi:hypothetical protein